MEEGMRIEGMSGMKRNEDRGEERDELELKANLTVWQDLREWHWVCSVALLPGQFFRPNGPVGRCLKENIKH